MRLGFILHLQYVEIEALKAHEVKSTCMEQFMNLINMKNFVLMLLPKPDSPEISREDEDREKWWITAIAWCIKFGPVKPTHVVFSDDRSSVSRFC